MGSPTPGHHYNASFVRAPEAEAFFAWLSTLRPIWEERYSAHHPPPEGKTQRRLLRPVYWLGSWQFACLDYYAPPEGTFNRAVSAEPFPPVMAEWVKRIDVLAHELFRREPEMPAKWELNTCLINFYGDRFDGTKWVDAARVGEHRDYEPGPVASISFGERALFQFVNPAAKDDAVVHQRWLDDRSLQLFGGERWKTKTFHRVQRVEDRLGKTLPPEVADFRTRRINLTFRYVPREHIVRYAQLPKDDRDDVRGYMEELARSSEFFRAELDAEAGADALR